MRSARHWSARLALSSALWLSLPAWGQDVAQWVARMNQALTTLDYHGDLVYLHGGQMEALRLYHAGGASVRERLVSVSGVPREVIRDGGRIVCIGTSAAPSLYADGGSAAPLLGALPGPGGVGLDPYYSLVLGGTERIAGLDAQQVEVRPRDAYRYGYRLWLERATGLPLKSVRFGADGRAVEQIMFTRIALNERPSEADLGTIAIEGAGQVALDRPQPASTTTAPWRVISPPDGFVLRLQRPPAADASVHLVYSDGLANVSVYVEPLRAQVPAFSGAANRGALNLYGRVLEGRQITVLGDVPAATVERFAQGVTAGG